MTWYSRQHLLRCCLTYNSTASPTEVRDLAIELKDLMDTQV